MKKLWEELNTLIAHAQCKCNCTCGFFNPYPRGETKRGQAEQSLMIESTAFSVNRSGGNPFRTNFGQQTNTTDNTGYTNFNQQGNNTGNNNYRGGYSGRFKVQQRKRIAANVHGGQGENGIESGDGNNVQMEEHDRTMQNLTKEQYNQLLSILENFHAGNGGNELKAGAVNFAGISAYSTHFGSGFNLYECSKSVADSWILDSGASNHMKYNKSMLSNVKILVYPFLVTLPNGYKVKVTLMGDIVMSPRFTLKRVLFVPSFKFNLISVHCLTVQLDCFVIFTKFSCILLQAPSLKRPLAIRESKDGLYLYTSDSCKSNTSEFCKSNPLVLEKSSSIPNKGDIITQSISYSVSSSSSVSPHSVSHITPSLHNSISSTIPRSHTSLHECNKDVKNSHVQNERNISPTCNASMTDKTMIDLLWHNRLGHVPFVKMRGIESIPVHFSTKQPFICPICPMPRQNRLPFSERTIATTKIFEILHVDLGGPYHVPTHDKKRYFITLVDDYSRCTWTHLLSCKSNALQVVKAFSAMVKNQFNCSIKTTRTDNGLEFINSEIASFLQFEGIIHQKTCPYTPQQNGIVERKYKYLPETAKALLYQSKLPMQYWGECILTSTYLINRLPSTTLKNECPLELLYKRKPKYSHLKSFGCLCFPTTLKTHKDKFESRSIPYVFVGYPFGKKGYKVLNLVTKRIHVSRDVIFHISVFPFALHSSSNRVFPSFPQVDSDLAQDLFPSHGSASVPSSPSPSLPTMSPDASSPGPSEPNTHTTSNSEEHSFFLNNNETFSNNTPSSTVQEPNENLGRPSRTLKVPTYLKDYNYSLPKLQINHPDSPSSSNRSTTSPSFNISIPNAKCVSLNALSSDGQQLIRTISHETEPSSYEEAAADPAWQAAMHQKFEALYANHIGPLCHSQLEKGQ
ncbi:PREDICTED: uncharacterized protein LOC109220963 [Nicotiana attenuata]|uniref:uncharacterized protein LOC109220963 n=1 Tax=Nicotiana attenuata TaxID=49451 RepID=UPI000904A538|nr:PREDICTED: uncharacterized protein LOC109220963 [Nicotiana attenuata]